MVNKTKIRIGVLAANACAISYMAFSPVIADMAAAFPGVDISLVQMVITLPSLMFIVFSPLAGRLMSAVPKKTLLLTALGLYLAGGLFPFFFHSSIFLILAGSVIIGCGSGLLIPVSNAVICDFFPQEERAGVMGLSATATAVGALVFIFVSSALMSAFGWSFCFLAFLLVLAAGGIVWKTIPAASGAAEDGTQTRSSLELNPFILALFVLGFVFFVVQNAFNTNSALYLAEAGIGNAASPGLATMCNTLGGILGGMVFGFATAKCRDQISSVAYGLICIGFFAAFFSGALPPLLAGGAMVGAGFAFYNAAGTYLLAKYLKPENNSFTVSIYFAVINLGGALSPFLVNGLTALTGGEQVRSRYLLCGIVAAAGTVLSVLLHLSHRKKLYTNLQ